MNAVELLVDDADNGYQLYRSNLVADNAARFTESCFIAKQRFDVPFGGHQPTWTYRYYNFFALTAGIPECYDLFRELKFIIRDYLKTDERLWFQSWFNFHQQEEVLKRHCHVECTAHGYIVVDPKKTRTVFDDYELINKSGNIYIGRPEKMHEVVVDEPFAGIRLTIAFDVISEAQFRKTVETYGVDVNLSYFPLD